MKSQKDFALHFVGIGGIGMSGIAEVLQNQGYRVSGSDLAASETTERLRKLGIEIFIGHKAENVARANVVVISSAVKRDNAEVLEAHRQKLPVIPRAEMLGELMRGKTGIAIAGSHGKTTTTSMMASILTHAGLDPTLVIGGKVDAIGGNAKLGQGKFVVAEADESDGSFLHLPATYAIVTNIDNDHLDHFGSIDRIDEAFLSFVAKIPFYGAAAICGEDTGTLRCMNRWLKPFLTYGIDPEYDFHAKDLKFEEMGSRFTLMGKSLGEKAHSELCKITLQVPGRHNVLNALAASVIARELGVAPDAIAGGLAKYTGVRRRFDIRWKDATSHRMIVDDYGHHPTEVKATLAAARLFWKGPILTVFQPHRYTRTQNCKDDFLTAFQRSDRVLISDIYAAGEDPIPGINSETLVKEMQTFSPGAEYIGDLKNALPKILNHFTPGTLLLCMGAGSITQIPELLLRELQKK